MTKHLSASHPTTHLQAVPSDASPLFDVAWSIPGDDGGQQIPETTTADVVASVGRYAVVAFFTILGVIGTVGNGIVLWVFWARRERVVTTLFIVVLAAVDLTTSLVVVPLTVFMEWNIYSVGVGHDILCKLYWVSYTFHFGQVNVRLFLFLSGCVF